MSDYDGFSITYPTSQFGGSRYDRKGGYRVANFVIQYGGPRLIRSQGLSLNPSGGDPTTTYYYRETSGARGSTTNPASIPVGAVVERIVTS